MIARPWDIGQSLPGGRGPGLFQVTYFQDIRALWLSRGGSVTLQLDELERKGIGLLRITHLSSCWQSQVITQVLTPQPSSFQPLGRKGSTVVITDLWFVIWENHRGREPGLQLFLSLHHLRTLPHSKWAQGRERRN